MSKIDQLEQEIHILRKHLIELAQSHELTDPEVVGASQILDSVLNEYEKLLSKSKHPK